ncbi:MAG: ATP-binding protein [Acidimicrobiaceae bacterium]|nr:ATP-binding protein [Acidimicrobiaceae bacterium]
MWQGKEQQKLRLPISIQTFREVRESGCYYVDKTTYIERLANEGKSYFLSRPRRFGKSLFLDTIKEAFECSRELFEGLTIHDRWDWSAPRPVVCLSFGSGYFTERVGLSTDLLAQLERIESEAGVHDAGLGCEAVALPGRFRRLLAELHRRWGRRVVVLVDEYDKPILDAIGDPDTARANRDFLRGFYAVIKDSDEHVRFALLTGVSKFSKVSLFSGLNNLIDITLESEFSSICGYTDDDLDTVFATELHGLDRDRIREWYNGYSWLGSEKVYNPYDVLLLFRKRRFGAYWSETGTPKFLVDTLIERGVSTVSLGDIVAGEDLLSTFDIDYIAVEALLFQTGYLTVVGEENRGAVLPLYRLDYPNLEVRMSLNRVLFRQLAQDHSLEHLDRSNLPQLLRDGDLGGIRGLLHRLYASIPYEWYTNNTITRFEGYYASVFYSYFAAQGFDIKVEDSSSHGRLDMAVCYAGSVFLFEFKVAGAGASPPVQPLEQMRERGYPDKYRSTEEPVYLIGVVFDPEKRNIAAFETALA